MKQNPISECGNCKHYKKNYCNFPGLDIPKDCSVHALFINTKEGKPALRRLSMINIRGALNLSRRYKNEFLAHATPALAKILENAPEYIVNKRRKALFVLANGYKNKRGKYTMRSHVGYWLWWSLEDWRADDPEFPKITDYKRKRK